MKEKDKTLAAEAGAGSDQQHGGAQGDGAPHRWTTDPDAQVPHKPGAGAKQRSRSSKKAGSNTKALVEVMPGQAAASPLLAGMGYSQEMVDVIKHTVAKGATDEEMVLFLSTAKKYGLDPMLKEIWFIKRVKKHKTGRKYPGTNDDIWDYPRLPDGSIDYSDAETIIVTSRDGYLKAAQRSPEWDGILAFTVCEGDTFKINAQDYTVEHSFGMKRGKIEGAWCKVDRKGHKPVIVTAPFNEYNNPKSDVWKQYPSAMIIKVAEAFALKRQFNITGLVTQEELYIPRDEVVGADGLVDVTPKASANLVPAPVRNGAADQQSGGKVHEPGVLPPEDEDPEAKVSKQLLARIDELAGKANLDIKPTDLAKGINSWFKCNKTSMTNVQARKLIAYMEQQLRQKNGEPEPDPETHPELGTQLPDNPEDEAELQRSLDASMARQQEADAKGAGAGQEGEGGPTGEAGGDHGGS